MISAPPQIPSYAQGFAPRDGPPANLNLWTGLQGLWVPALGPTGVTLFDQSPFKRDGTLTNMDPATDWVASEMGRALGLASAGNQYVIAPSPVSTYPFTLRWRANMLAYANDRAFIGLFDAGPTNDWFRLFTIASNRLRLQVTQGGVSAQEEINEATTSYTGWRDFALVCAAASDVRLFIDAEQVISFAPNQTPAGIANLIVGYNGQDQAYDGLVTLVAIYNRALPVTEIQQLYADPFASLRLRPRVYPAAVAEPSGHAGPLVNRTPLVSKLQGLCA